MPSPTQAVPIVRLNNPDGSPERRGLALSGDGPALLSLAKSQTERQGPGGTPVVRCRRAKVDAAGPSSKPRGLEDLDLADLVHLHKQLEEEQQSGLSELVIHGKVAGLAATLVVDTGASVSCISTSLWKGIHRSDPGWTLLPTRQEIRTVSGALVPVLGALVVEVELGSNYYAHRFLVMEMAEDVILGLDFIRKYDISWDRERDVLLFRGDEAKAVRRYHLGNGRCRRLLVSQDVRIPPRSQTVLAAKIDDRRKGSLPEWGTTDPLKGYAESRGIVVGRALVDPSAEVVPILVMNPTADPVNLSRNFPVAELVPAQCVGADGLPVANPIATSSTSEKQHRQDLRYAREAGEHTSSAESSESEDDILETSQSEDEFGDSGLDTRRLPKSSRGKHWSDSDSDSDLPDLRKQASTAETDRVPKHLRDLYLKVRGRFSPTDRLRLVEFLIRNSDVFAQSADDMGRTGWVKHPLKLHDKVPFKIPPRRLPVHKRPVVQEEVEKMLRRGVIEPCDGPWSSPIVLVTKKDGTSRFCVDYRRLNAATVKDAYPLPRIEDNLDALQGSKYFSTLDLLSGFWQVEVEPKDRDKTAFSVAGGGFYRFCTMPFGLTNAPGTFQRLMEKVLQGLQWEIAVLYIDDIVVFSATLDDHLDRLEKVMGRLRQAGLKLKPSKCDLLARQVEFLGHVVSDKGVGVDPNKIARVESWPTPTSLRQMRSFVGLCAYYRRFVPNFSSVCKPLFLLTKKGQPFDWGEAQQEAMDTMKRLLTKAPILGYPNSEGMFILDTDASNVGIGAVLSQVQDGQERVISYGSKVLNKAQRNYCVTRRELLAIVEFVGQYHHYLYGRKFLVRTDHAALYWLLRKKDPEGQMARWITKLSVYDMDIQHRPGLKHGNADALSRCMEGCRDTDFLEIPQGETLTLEGVRAKARVDEACRVTSRTQPVPHLEVCRVLTRGQAKRQKQPKADQGLTSLKLVEGHAPVLDGSVKPVSPTESNSVEGKSRKRPQKRSTKAKRQKASSDEDTPLSIFPPKLKPSDGKTPEEITALQLQEQYIKSTPPDDWSDEALYRLQELNPDMAKVKAWLRSKGEEIPSWNQLAKENAVVKAWMARFDQLYLSSNGVLYIVWESAQPKQPPTYRVAATANMFSAILRQLHDSRTAGHLGQKKTIERLKRSRFYWPGMATYGRRWVMNCDVCAARKFPKHSKRTPLQTYRVGTTMDRVSIDLLGPFHPRTSKGNSMILTVTDHFTRWVEAFPLREATAANIARCVVEFVCRFGMPLELHSDQGKNVDGHLIREVCELLGIRKTHTTAYHPSSNAITERENGVIKNMLSAYVNKRQTDWDQHLAPVMMAYRTSVHRILKESPSTMMLGRLVRLPIDVMVGLPPEAHYQEMCATEYAQELSDSMSAAHEVVTQHVESYYAYQKKQYDRQVKAETYQVGDAVWLREFPRRKGVSQSLMRNFSGPWMVVQKLSQVNFKIQRKNGARTQVVHSDRLKRYFGELEDPWAIALAQKRVPKDTD
ncbi:MAG: RNase H-like domain-containing protein [Pseudomonadota bacterium]|nr:RNase H-like domain-containing protein [Pseudomonadota bacterium]